MSRWAFALSRRWLRYLALAVIFAIACAGLAWWQLERRAEKVAEVQRIEQNYDAEPVPLSSVIDSLTGYRPSDEWRPVELVGRYETDQQLLVRNRPRGGNPGFEVLAPLRLADGSVFVVDRGWLPVESSALAPDSIPDPPAGEVTVLARLKPGEPTVPSGTTATGVLASIHLATIETTLGEPTYTGAYGLLMSESPATADTPLPNFRPEIDEGPHLSYAFQWVVFALIGFAGLWFAIRQEYRYLNADDPEERERANERERRRAAKRTDDDLEDALLDKP